MDAKFGGEKKQHSKYSLETVSEEWAGEKRFSY